MSLTIGSADAYKMLSGKKTKGFKDLMKKFILGNDVKYNAFASPIDALRTGAILENRFAEKTDKNYYSQYKSICKEYDCLVSTLDFAMLDDGKLVKFQELKPIFLTEYIDIILPISEMVSNEYTSVIRKKFKSNYIQVQFQMLCSGLDKANLTFLSVDSYDDEHNKKRDIKESEYKTFQINRDEEVINKIKERAEFFQSIKNYLNDTRTA